jgi:succinate dehydrogenase / fumarate reductase membrane anchor subunit
VVSRVVVGAHYGLRDWLAQRITAVVVAFYGVLLGGAWLALRRPLDYETWRQFFAQGWVRIATFVFALSLVWHAWVGMRDILMDYVRPTALRLAAQVLVLLLCAVYLAWTMQILWR